MAEVTPSREIILEEETDFRSPVSEAVAQKQAATSNFISKYQTKAFSYKFLGYFRALSLPEDGGRGLIFNAEIVGLSGILLNRGSSGTTEVDIRYYRAGVDQGSILSTTLQIQNGAGVAQFHTETEDASSSNTNVSQMPVLSVTNLDQGDYLVAKLSSNAVDAQNLTLDVHYRPR